MKILTLDKKAKYFTYEENGTRLLQGDYNYVGSDNIYRGRYRVEILHPDGQHFNVIRFPMEDLIIMETNKEVGGY